MAWGAVRRLTVILGTIGRAIRRDLGTFGHLKTNNFFLFIALIVYSAGESGMAPSSAYFMLLLLCLAILFPLSGDPLDKVPPSRLGSWPIGDAERFALRVMSLGLSPVLWLVILMLVLKRKTELAPALVTAAVGVQAIATVGRGIGKRVGGWNLLRFIPRFPGPFGGLVRSNLRQMLTMLDAYVAIAFSLGGAAYRFFGNHPDPAASTILALMAAMSLSTYAQCLFGLDRASSAMVRYRLMPVRGWQILMSKDAAFLIFLAILVAPLDWAAGMTSGFVALAVGHHASLRLAVPLRRWRFSGSRLFPSVVAGVGGLALGMGEQEHGILFLLAAIALWMASLAVYGRIFSRQMFTTRTSSL